MQNKFHLLLVFLFACIAQCQADGFAYRNEKVQGSLFKDKFDVLEIEQEQQVQRDISQTCFSQAGCNCLEEWEFQGRIVSSCSNPDQDRFGNWCEIDNTTCGKADYQFLDTLMYYGYCSCQDSVQSNGNLGSVPEEPLDSTVTSPSSAFQIMFLPPSQPIPSPATIFAPIPAPVASPQFGPSNFSTSPDKFSPSINSVLQISQEDCVTIINGGCVDFDFYLSFADGQVLESDEYLGYGYWQSSGWWMLSREIGDFTRWCSPTGYIGLYIQQGGLDNDLGSDIISMLSISSAVYCMDANNQFDFLTYKLDTSEVKDGHYGTPNPDFFYVVKETQERGLVCEDLGGVERIHQIIPTNTTLIIGQSCEFEDL